MAQVCKLAQDAAEEAASGLPVGFDPITILTIISALLPILQGLFSGCVKPNPTPAETRDFVSQRYRHGQYGAGVLNHAKRAAREEARNAGNPINRADAETVAIATLDTIRKSSDEDLQEAMQVT